VDLKTALADRAQDKYLKVAEVAGANATLRKPFPAQALLERLSSL
jgi:hypothetical protein